ncbi:SDR family oxidoreductase [Halalkalibacter alkalisediminis]|uniref:SDR family oxidoreductase n=1 Tax=Halalkalibacter alkalisediminis TaxID=935616 RepID=A0ABV6NMC9_9BACI|nr:SDR family oxidoreductase [Halalkalibacter alkalisediminis]
MLSKSILITGGTGKVGKQLIQHFLNKKYKVIFTSRNEEKIASLIRKFKNEGHNNKSLNGILVDLEQEKAFQNIINWFEKRDCWPNILVNNARNIEYLKINNGYMNRKNWLGELILEVVVPYELVMALVEHPKSQLENVINIASMYGVVPPNPNLYEDPKNESPINYGVAKAALIHLTKELSIRFASNGIRVNAISYGGIEGRVTENFKKRYAKLCPTGRMLHENEVAGAVEFLASNHSLGMTGQNLVVDGGWSVW